VKETGAIETFRPSWQAAILVCKDCQKRSSGPTSVKAKAVASMLKETVRGRKPRPRIVMSGCLGICPKRAIVIAAVSEDGAKVASIRRPADAEEAMRSMLPASPSA
jgi:predicted metal-binding protein